MSLPIETESGSLREQDDSKSLDAAVGYWVLESENVGIKSFVVQNLVVEEFCKQGARSSRC